MPSPPPTHSLQNSIYRGQKEKHYEHNITLANALPQRSGALRRGALRRVAATPKGRNRLCDRVNFCERSRFSGG
jgi:hypothetical protein